MSLLLLKVVLAPAFVVLASLVGRRHGVRVGGVVGGLPVIAGPILLVLALERGRSFASSAAAGTLLGIVALIAFVVAYVAASRRLAWPAALAAGWGAFLVGVAILEEVHTGALAGLALAAAACAGALVLMPHPRSLAPSPAPPRWDLLLRAVCAAVPVVAVTAAAHALGPHLSGLLAAFPIITPVLAAFTHAQQGPEGALRILRGFTAGFFAYALFCFVVAVAVRGGGLAVAFAAATVVALATQAVAVAVARRSEYDRVDLIQ
jgi:uncharacterized membrane protein (GlpM family)